MGLHETTIAEIRDHFGFSPRRLELIAGLERYLGEWAGYGLLDWVVVDGSFVTDKEAPSDIDMLLVPLTGSLFRLEWIEALSALASDSSLIKHTFGCHVFVTGTSESSSYQGWLDFFGHTKGGIERGLLSIR